MMNNTHGEHSRWGFRFSAGAGAVAAVLLSGILCAAAVLPSPQQSVGKKVTAIRLKDAAGKTFSLADFHTKKALVLVFIGDDCPISNSYAQPLSELQARLASRGVQIVGVNSNPDENAAAVSKHAREFQYGFPVLKDADQSLANAVGARVTPEAFVLDAGRVVRYRGRIDDLYASRTKKKNEATTHDLQDAIESVLDGKPVRTPVTTSFGCAIVRPEHGAVVAGVPTYHKDVEPIFQTQCQECHRPGQVAPFSLTSYKDAKSWAEEIKSFTASRQMPPWKAETGHGEFMDSRRMSDAQIALIGKWADAGAPEGSVKDAPTARQWSDGWMLGKPDLVLTVPETYHVTATGNDDFRCFVLPTGLKEDKQVVGVEIHAGNPRVVHHVLNFIDTTGTARKLDERDPGPGYASGLGGVGFFPTGALGGWAPGNFPHFLPKGVGLPLPAGSDLVMQVHYHKTGKPEDDQTSIGIYFAKEPIEKKLRVMPLTNLGIDIPAGDAHWPLKQSMRLPYDAHAVAITPHMHLLGREIRVTATLPDNTKKDLIWVKDWDYRWQDTYRFKDPVALPKGTLLELDASFDNSSSNPLNPNNPPKRVRFGEQTTDEMCFAFIQFTMDQEPPGGARSGLLGRLFGQ